MWINLNGKKKEVMPGATLLHLLTETGLKPGQVVIELNQEITDRSKYVDISLQANDIVEILEFVGGG